MGTRWRWTAGGLRMGVGSRCDYGTGRVRGYRIDVAIRGVVGIVADRVRFVDKGARRGQN